jgi:hypothetical protein
MRMKSTFMGAIEIVGEIQDLKVKDGWLFMNLRTTTPTGWNLDAALTHDDIMRLLRLMLRPRNLWYVIFGFGKPKDKDLSPEYPGQ